MKTLAILVLSVFAIASIDSIAVASDVVVSFDPAGTQGESPVSGFAPITLYVMGQGFSGVSGWAMAVEWSPTLTLAWLHLNPRSTLNLLSFPNFATVLGGCFGTPDSNYLFATIVLIYIARPTVPNDQVFCVKPVNADTPPTYGPFGYKDCAQEFPASGLRQFKHLHAQS